MSISHVLKTAKYSDRVIVVSDEKLKEIQCALVGMLKDVAEVFAAEDIKWFLSGGSILGAVRHQGFIPWDDDIDIFLERCEYEKLQKVFQKHLSDKYILRKPGDKGYLLNLPRIEKKGTVVQSIQSVGNQAGGLYIDIFLLENTYNNRFLRFLHGAISTALLFIDSSLRMKKCKKNIVRYTNRDPKVIKEVDKRAKYAKVFSFLPLEKWLKISDRWFSLVKRRGRYLVCPSGARHYFGEIFDSSWFDRTETRLFEGENWNVPRNPEKYLAVRYGKEFMNVPPEKERERHVYARLDLGNGEI